MNRLTKTLFGLGLGVSVLAGSSTTTLAQDGHIHGRTCHSTDNLERLLEKDPSAAVRMRNIESFTEQYVQNQKSQRTEATVYTIPVVVHVLYNTSSQNITDAQIQSQIDVLNEDFRKTNSDVSLTPSLFASLAADSEIEFVLATTDPSGNATTGITRKQTSVSAFSTNDAMKYTSQGGQNAWDTQKYLNIWVCNMSGGILGYAQFPGSGSASTDGVVILTTAFGRNGSAQSPFNKGRTATHEVGHWLNLRHIWGDANCGNDFVSDTPTQQTSNGGCPSFPKPTCGNTSDMFMNYMDYVNDACMYMFTEGQKSRMRAVLAAGGFREALVSGTVTPPPPPSGYCASKGSSVSDEWIAGVKIGSLNKTSGANGGYVDFTSNSVDLARGSSNSITLTPGFAGSTYNEYWKVWIDFNNDNDFEDAGELVYDAGSATSAVRTGTVTIPSSVATGSTRMRVSMKYNGAQTSCETFSYGEVEDYTVNITSGSTTPSCGVPSGLSTSSVTSSSFTASWSAVSGASSYDVRVRPSGGSWSTLSSTSASLSVTGASASTTYEVQVRANCSGTSSSYSSSVSVTTTAPPTTSYCASKGNSVADEWIQRVRLGSIDNNSGANGGYANFTNLSTTLAKGTSYTITINPAWSGSTYSEAYNVWIDYNQDGDFNDSGEAVYTRSRSTSTQVSGSFTVPSSALNGTTRMRVSMKYNANATSCETFSYGEVEDYTVVIGAANRANINPAPTAHRTEQANDENVRGLKDGDFAFVAFPNPASSTLTVRLGYFGKDSEVVIYSITGAEMMRATLTEQDTELNISGLSKGMYILGVNNGREVETIKFIKE